MSRQISKIVCTGCNITFEKETKYVNQAAKRGQKKLYCGLACACADKNRHHPNFQSQWFKKGHVPANNGTANIFRSISRTAKTRGKQRGLDCTITPMDVEAQWTAQDGKCAYTGRSLTLERNSSIFNMASLDRIDSNKPYEVGNIQFIVCALNLAKQKETDANFRRFLGELGVST